MIDLHTHSNCSDGTFSPRELVNKAKKTGVTRMALTDHDTIEGLGEARREAEIIGVAFIGGLEFSAEYQPGTMHILGYGFDERNERLLERIEYVQNARERRNPEIVSELNRLGMDITLEEIIAESGGGLVGRPHIAAVLLKKGYVATRQEAFDLYLAKGMPAYRDKVRLSPAESIDIIRNAGGAAVLAHPLQLKAKDAETLDAVIRELADLGLRGIECYYRNHSRKHEERFLSLARRYNLIATGGSDFHGSNRPEIHLGTGEGGLRVPVECWDGLQRAIEDAKLA